MQRKSTLGNKFSTEFYVSSNIMARKIIEVFISYSHKDDDLREEFVTHLANLKRQGKITAWHDRAIEAGEEWEAQIKGNLESAQIILLLISPPFMASDYCYDIEMQRAIERHDAGTARVIPIILRPCDWKDSPFSKLQVLPKDGKPVTQWSDRDTAFLNVVEGIRKAVESLRHESSLSSPSAVITSPAQPIQLEIDPPPSSPLARSSFQKRFSLFQLLSSLPVPQFEQIVFVLQPPAGNVPPASAPQGQRVPALLEWAESPIGCGLDTLEQVLHSIEHPR
jgi:hypothetical protein